MLTHIHTVSPHKPHSSTGCVLCRPVSQDWSVLALSGSTVYTEWVFLPRRLSLSVSTPVPLLSSRHDRFPFRMAGQSAWETIVKPQASLEMGAEESGLAPGRPVSWQGLKAA